MQLTILFYIAAAILVVILICIIRKQITEYHLEDDPMLNTLREILKPLHPIFNTLKLYKGEKSYTINKEKTFLCLYDQHGEYYPLQMIVYVLLHEVSHVLNTKDIGHTEEFHRIFDELLDRAIVMGIYNPSIPVIQDYCNY